MIHIHSMPGHLIRRLHQISQSVFHAHMQDRGIELTPVQFAALSVLAHHDGIDQATLAGLIAYDRVTIGGVVDRLEAKALVKREVSPKDRRARVLSLTDAGKALVDSAEASVIAVQDDMLCGLTPDERAQFIALAAKATEGANDLSRAPLRSTPRNSAPRKSAPRKR